MGWGRDKIGKGDVYIAYGSLSYASATILLCQIPAFREIQRIVMEEVIPRKAGF